MARKVSIPLSRRGRPGRQEGGVLARTGGQDIGFVDDSANGMAGTGLGRGVGRWVRVPILRLLWLLIPSQEFLAEQNIADINFGHALPSGRLNPHKAQIMDDPEF